MANIVVVVIIVVIVVIVVVIVVVVVVVVVVAVAVAFYYYEQPSLWFLGAWRSAGRAGAAVTAALVDHNGDDQFK